MSDVTRLIVWRHGESEWNAIGRIQGQMDVALSDLGRAQAAAAAAWMAARKPDVIVSSDLRRAADTAAPLAALTGLPVHLDPRLRERDFGQWQGLTGAEVNARDPAASARWRTGERVDCCGVEELDALAKRVATALLQAADRAPGGTVVVASHGAAIKHGITELLGWPNSLPNTLAGLDNCHWVDLWRGSGREWRLHAYNQGLTSAEPPAAR